MIWKNLVMACLKRLSCHLHGVIRKSVKYINQAVTQTRFELVPPKCKFGTSITMLTLLVGLIHKSVALGYRGYS